MTSLKQAIQTDTDLRQMPSYQPGSMRSLATSLKLPFPLPLKELISALNNLPFAVHTFEELTLQAQSLTAQMQLGIQSDGSASFHGQVDNSNFFKQNWLCAAMLTDVKDSSGSPLVFVQTGDLDGAIGSSHSTSFQQDGRSDLIANQWDVAKASRIQYKLHVSTDGPELAFDIVLTAFAIATAVFFGSGDRTCTWGARNEDGTTTLLRCQ